MLGDFDFEELRLINPVLGPILFSIFAMLVVFVLLNMFIAIISDSFDETKKALADEQVTYFNTPTSSLSPPLFLYCTLLLSLSSLNF